MRCFAVTSGKGGVGKTNFSINLAISLASLGHKVVVFDADLGLANVDIILGTHAKHTLQDVLGGPLSIEEILTPGPGGINFIAGGSAVGKLTSISRKRLQEFLAGLAQLEASTDYLIFDTGAGIDTKVMTFLRAADEVLLVTTPDPASITDAYATAKTLFRVQRNAIIRVVMNMVSSEEQAMMLFSNLQGVCQQFLHGHLSYCGCVHNDAKVSASVRQRKPFYLASPECKASVDISQIADKLTKNPLKILAQPFIDRLNNAFDPDNRFTKSDVA
ncbi:MAG: MinD/ParA family protein [bacterium]